MYKSTLKNYLIKVITAVLCLAMMTIPLDMAFYAKEYESTGYQTALAPKAKPTIDGVIAENEGWSNAVYLNETYGTRSWGSNPLMAKADIYFAYSDSGIYFAVDLTEIATGEWYNGATGEIQTYTKLSSGVTDSIIESTGLDTTYENDTTNYGFDGDVICFTIDPLGLLEKDEYNNLTRYNVAFVNGKTEVYRSVTNNGFITEEVEAVCVIDHENNKMMCECYIPYSIICSDLNAETNGKYSLTPDDLSEYDAESRAMITYMDRFIDPEQEAVETFSRYMTVCRKTWDGRDAIHSDSAYVTRDYGIIIKNGDCAHLNTTSTLIQEATHTQKGYYDIFCNDCQKHIGLKSVPRLENPNPFTDVENGKWFTTAIANCFKCGYITGTSQNKFSPNAVMTRSMAVQILAKICKADLKEYGKTQIFTDVPTGKWYSSAVEWANQNSIASGVGNSKFSPNGQLTREQLCLMLKKTADLLGVDTSYDSSAIDAFKDKTSVHSWGYGAMCWAYEKGLVSGTSADKLSPTALATRAQIAVIIINFDDQFITYPKGSYND